jgi:hypothetical protein
LIAEATIDCYDEYHPGARDLRADPLAAWTSAFDALLERGVVDLGGNGPPWGQTVDAAIPDVIVRPTRPESPSR